jgi:hypothetical protein
VDNKPVVDKILLKDNDLIEIGQRKFIFHSLEPGSAKVVAHELLCAVAMVVCSCFVYVLIAKQWPRPLLT